MIKINDHQLSDIKIKLFFGDELTDHQFLNRKCCSLTLIAEEKTVYLYFKNPAKISHQCLKQTTTKIVAFTERFANVSFDVTKLVNHDKQRFAFICEAIAEACHKPFTMKTKPAKQTAEKVFNLIVPTEDIEQYRLMLHTAEIKMRYVNLARDWQDHPPNILHSEHFADLITQAASKHENVTATVLDKVAIKAENMNLLLSVNAASQYEPRVVILKYTGNPSSDHSTAIVGKGITFDTGGISLKPSAFMKGMKFDMSGAAIASASLLAIAEAKLPVNVYSIACITDNTVDAQGTLVESVITSMNGKTVQIDNTDAEGRLAVADGINYAIKNLHCNEVIELSTLTGAILVALGTETSGVFGNNKAFLAEMVQACNHAHEAVWPLPVKKEHINQIRKTPVADISNVGAGRNGMSCVAAAFLFEFAEKTPFIHFDIAGTATNKESTRGTGVMVRSLFELFAHRQ